MSELVITPPRKYSLASPSASAAASCHSSEGRNMRRNRCLVQTHAFQHKLFHLHKLWHACPLTHLYQYRFSARLSKQFYQFLFGSRPCVVVHCHLCPCNILLPTPHNTYFSHMNTSSFAPPHDGNNHTTAKSSAACCVCACCSETPTNNATSTHPTPASTHPCLLHCQLVTMLAPTPTHYACPPPEGLHAHLCHRPRAHEALHEGMAVHPLHSQAQLHLP